MWLVSSSILPLVSLIYILQNFRPLTKLGLVVSRVGDLPPFPLDRASNLFLLSSSIYSLKKESEKLQTSHFGQIHEQFEFHTP